MDFDVIITGGSYAGLAAGMALGRSLRKVLIIDDNAPCNRQTPHSHNFITHDGRKPAEIVALARQQVEKYDTVQFFSGRAVKGVKTTNGFEIQASTGETFRAKKLIFATGIKDLLPAIAGLAECWGISVLHCPYCHGYEVRNERTGILSNGQQGYDLSALISNWTKELTLFTNGPSTLTAEQAEKLKNHNIAVVETEVEQLEHNNGYISNIIFKDGSTHAVKALYAHAPFEQHCPIPESLGCELADGYIKTDGMQRTNIPGVFACGDNCSRLRTVANAVATGTFTGMALNKELIMEQF